MEKDRRKPACRILYSCRCIHLSAADSTLQTIQPVPEEIQARVVSPNGAAASCRSRLGVSPSSKSTTIAQLTVTGSQVARGVDFLNKLVEVYNEEGNNDKMR